MRTDVHASLLREIVARDGGAWFTCAGRSMSPTFELGARLRVVADRPRVGDVMLFEGADAMIVHRLIARLPAPGGWLLVHAGDAHPRTAGITRDAAVIGRVLATRRPGSAAFRVRAAARAVFYVARSIIPSA